MRYSFFYEIGEKISTTQKQKQKLEHIYTLPDTEHYIRSKLTSQKIIEKKIIEK